jgi:4-carboxymuconolactone decarboxylase
VVEKRYAMASADQLHIEHFLSASCFSDYLTRTGIDLPTLELLTLSMLVALGGCEGHVKGRSPWRR